MHFGKWICTVSLAFVLCASLANVAFADMRQVDSDSWQGAYSSVYASLLRQEDTSFCRLNIDVESHSQNKFVRPMFVKVFVYLPTYTEYVLFGDMPPRWIGYWLMGTRIMPDIEKSEDFCVAHWALTKTTVGIGQDWLFMGDEDSSVLFKIPPDKPAMAYVYVETVFYSFNPIFFSEVANEKAFWLQVKENTNTSFTQPQAVPQTSDQTLLLAVPTFDLILGGSMILALLSYQAIKKRGKTRASHPASDPTAVSVQSLNQRIRQAPHAVAAVPFFFALAGLFNLVVGYTILEWQLPLGTLQIMNGILLIIISVGLGKRRAWGWFAAMIFCILGLTHAVLFPTPNPTILLEPIALFYLAWRRPFFKASN